MTCREVSIVVVNWSRPGGSLENRETNHLWFSTVGSLKQEE